MSCSELRAGEIGVELARTGRPMEQLSSSALQLESVFGLWPPLSPVGDGYMAAQSDPAATFADAQALLEGERARWWSPARMVVAVAEGEGIAGGGGFPCSGGTGGSPCSSATRFAFGQLFEPCAQLVSLLRFDVA
jgi:hypothetical protein